MVYFIEHRKLFSFTKCFYENISPDIDKVSDRIEIILLEKQNNVGFEEKEDHTLLLDLHKSYADLWGGLRKKFIREQVTKAIDRGFKFLSPISREKFYILYKDFVEKKGYAEPLSQKVFENVGEFSAVEYEGKILSAGAFLSHEKKYKRLWLLASRQTNDVNREYVGWANRLLLWKTILQAKDDGFSFFDFGGITLDTKDSRYGITEFKQAFGGTIVPEYHYKKTNSLLLRMIGK